MVLNLAGNSFFERRLCGRIALRVRGPRFLTRQVQPLEQAREPPWAVVDAVRPLDVLAQIDQTPGAHPIALGFGSAQDVGLERCLPAGAELFRATGSGPVVQTVRSLSIEALDGIVQGLALHAGQPGRLGPGHALERIGNGQQPQAGPGVPLTSGPLAEVGS